MAADVGGQAAPHPAIHVAARTYELSSRAAVSTSACSVST